MTIFEAQEPISIMDKELKEKWIEALRYGPYKQGTGKLHIIETDSYCCLGVLCEVAGFEKKPGGNPETAWVSQYLFPGYDEPSYAFTTKPNSQWLNEIGIPPEDVDRLWRLNDIELFSFDQIADWIERHL